MPPPGKPASASAAASHATRFAKHFREHVQPLLAAMITGLATDMAHPGPLEGPDRPPSFAVAFSEVMTFARRRGASYLSEAVLADLEDWVATTLLDAALLADEAAEVVERLRHEPSRQVMREAIAAFAAPRGASGRDEDDG